MTQPSPPASQDDQSPQELYRLATLGDAAGLLLALPAFVGSGFIASALARASCEGHVECVKLLVPHVLLADEFVAAAAYAAGNGQEECLRILLAAMPRDPLKDAEFFTLNGSPSSPLALASYRGHVGCVSILLSLAIEGCSAKSPPAYPSSLAEVAIASSSACYPNVVHASIVGASCNGHLECVQMLAPWCRPSRAAAALIPAARGGHSSCASFLAGLPGSTLPYLSSAIDAAGEKGYFECVEILSKKARELPGCPSLLDMASDSRHRGFHGSAEILTSLADKEALTLACEGPPVDSSGCRKRI